MTVTQYAVIILRDDEEDTLPGAPVTLSPLVFEPGLEKNEIVFTKDTGRMFVGHDPEIGQSNFRRTTFPYQNVEVLTELSVDRFNTMVGGYRRAEGDESYFYSVLPASSSMTPVILPLVDDPTHVFRLEDVTSLAATFDYAGFNSAGKPVKMGQLRLLYGTGVGSPTCVDNGTDLGASLLTFTASIAGSVGSQYLVVNYQYTGTGNLTLRFRVTRPTFTSGV